MRHRKSNNQLGMARDRRASVVRNLATSLIEHEHVVTTVARARAVRGVAEKLITLGKAQTVHARRLANRIVYKESVLQKLFGDVAPRFADRKGGYTRFTRLGFRRGDAAELAKIEWLPVEKKAAAGGATGGKGAKGPGKSAAKGAKTTTSEKSTATKGKKKVAEPDASAS